MRLARKHFAQAMELHSGDDNLRALYGMCAVSWRRRERERIGWGWVVWLAFFICSLSEGQISFCIPFPPNHSLVLCLSYLRLKTYDLFPFFLPSPFLFLYSRHATPWPAAAPTPATSRTYASMLPSSIWRRTSSRRTIHGSTLPSSPWSKRPSPSKPRMCVSL